MSQVLNPDSYGRTVEFSTDGVKDIYVVKDSDGVACITIRCPIGKPIEQVYYTINGMAPSDQSPAPVESLEERVEQLEQEVDQVQAGLVEVQTTVSDIQTGAISVGGIVSDPLTP